MRLFIATTGLQNVKPKLVIISEWTLKYRTYLVHDVVFAHFACQSNLPDQTTGTEEGSLLYGPRNWDCAIFAYEGVWQTPDVSVIRKQPLGCRFSLPLPLVLFRTALGSFILLFEYPAHGKHSRDTRVCIIYKGKNYS